MQINSAWTIPLILKKQINIVFTCDRGRYTYLGLWFLEVLHVRFLASSFRVLLEILSFLKIPLSSKKHYFVQLLLKGQNNCTVFCASGHHPKGMAESSDRRCFCSNFLMKSHEMVSWLFNTEKRCSAFLQIRETKLRLQLHFFHLIDEQRSRSLVITV